MRISRIFTDQSLVAEATVRLEEAPSHYLARVLRLKEDDPVVLFNGDGFDYAGAIADLSRHAVHVDITSRLPAVPESPLRVTLVQSVSRGERMDYTLQKCTELGVSAFLPLFTERVEVHLAGSRLEKRMKHWQGVIRSACEQSGRAVLPELREPMKFNDWLASPADGERFLLDPQSDASLSSFGPDFPSSEWLIGPEGGLTDHEIKLAGQAGVKFARLGPRVLRTETAGPALAAALQCLFGDF